jgi:hypothetical protein
MTASPIAQVLSVLGAKGEADGPDAVLADMLRAEAPALIRALVEAGVEITEARWREADLEGVYLGALGQPDNKNGDRLMLADAIAAERFRLPATVSLFWGFCFAPLITMLFSMAVDLFPAM